MKMRQMIEIMTEGVNFVFIGSRVRYNIDAGEYYQVLIKNEL